MELFELCVMGFRQASAVIAEVEAEREGPLPRGADGVCWCGRPFRGGWERTHAELWHPDKETHQGTEHPVDRFDCRYAGCDRKGAEGFEKEHGRDVHEARTHGGKFGAPGTGTTQSARGGARKPATPEAPLERAGAELSVTLTLDQLLQLATGDPVLRIAESTDGARVALIEVPL